MDLDELEDLCRAPVEGLKGGPVVPDHIYLVLARDNPPGGAQIRLAGRAGPLGRVCNVRPRGDGRLDIVATFKRKGILEWISRARPMFQKKD